MSLKGVKKEALENRWEKAREVLFILISVQKRSWEILIFEDNLEKNARKTRLVEGTWKMQKLYLSQQRNKTK